MYLLDNVFYGELDLSGGDIASGDSSITLETGDVARLGQTPTATDPMLFTIWDKAYEHAGAARKAGGKWEIIEVTGKDSGTDTLAAGTRGFSNSSAQSYNSADNTTFAIVQTSADEVYDELLIAGADDKITTRGGTTLDTINAATMLQIGGTDLIDSGTWTPADGSGAGLTFTTSEEKYEKNGSQYRVSARIDFPSTADGSNATITGLPATPDTNYIGAAVINDASINGHAFVNSSGELRIVDGTASSLSNSDLSGKIVRVNITYRS